MGSRTMRPCLLLLFLVSWKSNLVQISALATTTASNPPSLFPYQRLGVDRLVRERRVLLADEMGLGKTAQAICALNQLFEQGKLPSSGAVLIVCPKSVLGVWQDELETWLSPTLERNVHTATATQPPPNNTPSADGSNRLLIQLINYDICDKFQSLLQANDYDVLICDEAHYLKSVDAKRTRAVLGDGTVGGAGIRSTYLWLLTGTPIMNRPIELYPLLRAIDPIEYRSRDDFVDRYCDPKQSRWGTAKNVDGAANLGELSRRLRPLMIRRYKSDVLAQLPPKFRSCVSLMAEGDAQAARRFEREMVAELMQHDPDQTAQRNNSASGRAQKRFNLDAFSADASDLLDYLGCHGSARYYSNITETTTSRTNRVLGALATIRKNTALLKVPPAIQLLKDATLSHKVVVFAHHRELIRQIGEAFGDSVCVVGGMDADSRIRAVRSFQTDPRVRLFVGSIRATGVGVTLTAASHVVFLELDPSPSVMAQAEDRCHRVGQKDSVQVQYYVFQDTIDEWLARKLLSKQSNIDRVLLASRDTSSSVINEYTIDFGKHRGLRIEDVPRDYLTFIIETDNGAIWRSRPALWKALANAGYVHEDPPPANPHSMRKKPTLRRDVDYTFDFGKHNGKAWQAVPSSYRDWVIRESVWEKRPNLKDALLAAGRIECDSIQQQD